MRWERIELYIEHLFPGLLVLFLSMAFLGDISSSGAFTPQMHQLLQSEFAAVAIFLSASYVVAALVSRMLIDWLSDFTFSYWFFKAVAKRFIGAAAATDRMALLRDYDEALAWATMSQNDGYRQSVARRRERAGLVRTCFVPVVFAVAIWLKVQAGFPALFSFVVALPIALLVVLPLFGYAESLIYQECLKDKSRLATQ